ncbi:MAG: hypothetical protein ACRDSE_18875 [Pseudonocardiaceae bacterium]
MLSQDAGEQTPPLLEETIGARLGRTVAQWPGREALVEVATGRLWTWAEFDHAVDAVARGLIAYRHEGRPGRHVGARAEGGSSGADGGPNASNSPFSALNALKGNPQLVIYS